MYTSKHIYTIYIQVLLHNTGATKPQDIRCIYACIHTHMYTSKHIYTIYIQVLLDLTAHSYTYIYNAPMHKQTHCLQYTHIHTHTLIVHTNTHIHTYIHTNMSIYIHTHKQTHSLRYTHIHTHTLIIHTHTHKYIQIYIYNLYTGAIRPHHIRCIYTCIHIHMYTSKNIYTIYIQVLLDLTTYGELSGAHILQHLPSPVQVSFHVTSITNFITNSRATLAKRRPHPAPPAVTRPGVFLYHVRHELFHELSFTLFDLTTYMSHLSRTLSWTLVQH